jgi:ribosomal protein L28
LKKTFIFPYYQDKHQSMGKREELIEKMKPVLNDTEKLKKFIVENSNLPGPRGNLELAFAFAEIYDNKDILLEWVQITEEQADANNPESFPAFCAAVCLGKIYTKKKDQEIIVLLKKLANDGRWRMREAVAFAFQIIGEHDFDALKEIVNGWIKHSNNHEKRAILVSLAHPKFLNEERALFCFEITEAVLKDMDKENDFDVLRKGLEFTISVFAAANPEAGFSFIRKWIGKDKITNRIMKQNLTKNRLIKKDPEKAEELLKMV